MNRTIAVVGASTRRHKFGNKCVRAYASAGWEVYPVNPHADEIEGLSVFRTVADARKAAGGELNRIALYLQPDTTRRVLPEIAEAEVAETFFNPGSATPSVLADAETMGIAVRDACAIVDIGLSPSAFP